MHVSILINVRNGNFNIFFWFEIWVAFELSPCLWVSEVKNEIKPI